MSRNAHLQRLIFAVLLTVAASFVGLSERVARADDSTPAGTATNESQVVIVQDPHATDAFEPRSAYVQLMVDRGIMAVTGKSNVPDAWRSVVSTQDIVGIKVFSEPGPNSGTRPAVVEVVVQGLLRTGIPTNHIIIWDKTRKDLYLAGYNKLAHRYSIRVTGSAEAGYDPTNFYSTPLLGNLAWGDLEFGQKGDNLGRKSFVSMLVSREITKIISIAPLMNHNQAGVCGSLFSLALGSVDNTARFETPERLAVAVPELYALPSLGDRVALNIVDALICQYEGEERSLLHYSTVLNELRFSFDPVALDVLSLQELVAQRQRASAPAVNTNMELYRNAALLQLGVADTNHIHISRISAESFPSTSRLDN